MTALFLILAAAVFWWLIRDMRHGDTGSVRDIERD